MYSFLLQLSSLVECALFLNDMSALQLHFLVLFNAWHKNYCNSSLVNCFHMSTPNKHALKVAFTNKKTLNSFRKIVLLDSFSLCGALATGVRFRSASLGCGEKVKTRHCVESGRFIASAQLRHAFYWSRACRGYFWRFL